MTPEISALIGLASVTAAGQFALWLRFEHRMTVLEERMRLREVLEEQGRAHWLKSEKIQGGS